MQPMSQPMNPFAGARRDASSRLGAAGMQDMGGQDTGDEGKVPMRDANYRRAEGATGCASCVNFSPPDRCEVVAGRVDAGGLCDLYEPADAQAPGQEAGALPPM